MKSQLYIALFVALLLITTGCKTQKSMFSFAQLEGEWRLAELNGQPVDREESRQFIAFDVVNEVFSGNAGCNRMSGKLEFDKDQPGMIRFGRAVTTRMACPALDSEQRFLAAMEEVVRFETVSSGDSVKQVAFYNENDTKLFMIQNR